jgi:hypothetical protein
VKGSRAALFPSFLSLSCRKGLIVYEALAYFSVQRALIFRQLDRFRGGVSFGALGRSAGGAFNAGVGRNTKLNRRAYD